MQGRPDNPRYATLRDYLQVVRSNRWIILLIALAFAAAAFALTARQKATYQASASVFFQDTNQELNLLGDTAAPSLPDATRAQIQAETIASPPIAQRVKAMLHSPLSLGALSAPISTYVNQQTATVVIQATSGSPAYAQELANAFAQATKAQARTDAKARYESVIAGVRAQLAPLQHNVGQGDAVTRSVYAQRLATLEVVANTVDPVQIIQNASLPTTPAGPRTIRNTVLGLLLGMIVGLIAAFVRDALDRRLRGPAQIGEELGWPVLGHVRDSAFGPPVFISANGDGETQDGDRESFRILRQNMRFLDVDHPPKTVVVTSALPEEGKSTVAASLACASAIAGIRTLLVECDLRRPALADRLGLSKRPGLTDFLLGEASPQDIVQVVALAPPLSLNGHASNGSGPAVGSAEPRRLACITAGSPSPETAELLGSARFKAFVKEVSAAYDQVVIDAGPLLSVADTAMLIPESEATLLCVRTGRTTRDQAAAVKRALDRIPHEMIGVVVTGVRPGTEHDLGDYSYAYSYQPAG